MSKAEYLEKKTFITFDDFIPIILDEDKKACRLSKVRIRNFSEWKEGVNYES